MNTATLIFIALSSIAAILMVNDFLDARSPQD